MLGIKRNEILHGLENNIKDIRRLNFGVLTLPRRESRGSCKAIAYVFTSLFLMGLSEMSMPEEKSYAEVLHKGIGSEIFKKANRNIDNKIIIKGSVNNSICSSILQILNSKRRAEQNGQDGQDGQDGVEFELVQKESQGFSPKLYQARADIDGDGVDESIYKVVGYLSGTTSERIIISSQVLLENSTQLEKYSDGCAKNNLGRKCVSLGRLLYFAAHEPPSNRLESEWSFTKNNQLSLVERDQKSRALAYKLIDGQVNRVFGNLDNVSWSIYSVGGKKVFVSSPSSEIAGLESLAFIPNKNRDGDLLCIFENR